MRNRLCKIVCLFTVLFVVLGLNISPVYAKKEEDKNPIGIMSSAYGYALNDMISIYGVAATAQAGEIFPTGDLSYTSPNGGVVYADLIDFNQNGIPFMVVFLINSGAASCEAHILSYDTVANKVEEIGVISKPYNTITGSMSGEFNIGKDNGKSYISYILYENQVPVYDEYYTVIDNNAFMFVKSPQGIDNIGIMDFNSKYFHSSMDISYYNKTLGDFFKKLKDTAADSVTHEDISQNLDKDEENLVEDTLAKAVGYSDFDISRFKSMTEYKQAMNSATNSDRFYLITNMYSLGEEIYYVRFSTDRSFYNYTLLRRSDSAENGYQILKVRTDCIPLSDYELEQIFEAYKRSTLLLKKSSDKLKLVKSSASDTEKEPKINLPKFETEKFIPKDFKFPLTLIGGGLALVVLLIVFVIIIRMNKED